jgi:hypothetical protein
VFTAKWFGWTTQTPSSSQFKVPPHRARRRYIGSIDRIDRLRDMDLNWKVSKRSTQPQPLWNLSDVARRVAQSVGLCCAMQGFAFVCRGRINRCFETNECTMSVSRKRVPVGQVTQRGWAVVGCDSWFGGSCQRCRRDGLGGRSGAALVSWSIGAE